MFAKRKKFQQLNKGDIILLSEDGTEKKPVFFGLFSREVSRTSPFEIIEKSPVIEGMLYLTTKKLDSDIIRKITVLPYWKATLHKG